MITRFNYEPRKKRDISNDDVFYKFSYVKKIIPISTNKDGSIGEYVEKGIWKKEKCSWKEFSASYDLGTVQEQVMNHITKGTPLITTHTLPSADYTKIQKGAEIKREMVEKGITLDMLIDAVKSSLVQETPVVDIKKEEVVNNG